MSTGDILNHFNRLRRLLIQISYPAFIDPRALLSNGDPSIILPILRYTFTSLSHSLSSHYLSLNYDLYQSTPGDFIVTIYKLLRTEFSYHPKLSYTQVLSSHGYAERKLLFLIDCIVLNMNLHNRLLEQERKCEKQRKLAKKVRYQQILNEEKKVVEKKNQLHGTEGLKKDHVKGNGQRQGRGHGQGSLFGGNRVDLSRLSADQQLHHHHLQSHINTESEWPNRYSGFAVQDQQQQQHQTDEKQNGNQNRSIDATLEQSHAHRGRDGLYSLTASMVGNGLRSESLNSTLISPHHPPSDILMQHSSSDPLNTTVYSQIPVTGSNASRKPFAMPVHPRSQADLYSIPSAAPWADESHYDQILDQSRQQLQSFQRTGFNPFPLKHSFNAYDSDSVEEESITLSPSPNATMESLVVQLQSIAQRTAKLGQQSKSSAAAAAAAAATEQKQRNSADINVSSYVSSPFKSRLSRPLDSDLSVSDMTESDLTSQSTQNHEQSLTNHYLMNIRREIDELQASFRDSRMEGEPKQQQLKEKESSINDSNEYYSLHTSSSSSSQSHSQSTASSSSLSQLKLLEQQILPAFQSAFQSEFQRIQSKLNGFQSRIHGMSEKVEQMEEKKAGGSGNVANALKSGKFVPSTMFTLASPVSEEKGKGKGNMKSNGNGDSNASIDASTVSSLSGGHSARSNSESAFSSPLAARIAMSRGFQGESASSSLMPSSAADSQSLTASIATPSTLHSTSHSPSSPAPASLSLSLSTLNSSSHSSTATKTVTIPAVTESRRFIESVQRRMEETERLLEDIARVKRQLKQEKIPFPSLPAAAAQ